MTTTLPAISVVIPTRDRPALVQRAALSVLRQTFADFEIIVVIDGPDSETCDSLAAIPDSRLRVVHLAESVGGSEARNTGVRAARGEWVALLDDDDEWLPEKLAKQIAVARSSSYGFPIVATALIARSPRGDFDWPKKKPTYPLSEYLFTRSSLFQGEAVLQSSTLMTRRQLLLNCPFTPGLRRHQDWDWILRAANVCGAGLEFIPEALAIWYIDSPSTALKIYDWRYSIAWARANRQLFTPKAYAGFMAVTVSAQAAWQGQWRAFFPVLKEAIFRGRPRMLDLSLCIAMWLVPRGLRQGLRTRVTAVNGHITGPSHLLPVKLAINALKLIKDK